MKTAHPLIDLLAAPLDEDWTIDRLAERLLHEIAVADPPEQELRVDAASDLQSRRLIRPLLARLATMSAAENGSEGNVFVGNLTFRRLGPGGLVEIRGTFRNMQSDACASFRHGSAIKPRDVPGRQEADGNGVTEGMRLRNPAVLTGPACENPPNSK